MVLLEALVSSPSHPAPIVYLANWGWNVDAWFLWFNCAVLTMVLPHRLFPNHFHRLGKVTLFPLPCPSLPPQKPVHHPIQTFFVFFLTQPAPPLKNTSGDDEGEVQNSSVLLVVFIYATMPSRVLWSEDWKKRELKYLPLSLRYIMLARV